LDETGVCGIDRPKCEVDAECYVNILVVHEVNYLSKIVYEFQILPEILSILGHKITVIDYDDTWQSERKVERSTLRTRIHRNVNRAYPEASVTVRRPGMIRLPLISRLSGALTAGADTFRFLRRERPDIVLLYGLPTVGAQAIAAARCFRVPIVFRAIDVTHQLVPYAPLVAVTKVLEKFVFNSVDFNIALTPHLRNYIRSYGVPEEHIRLLPSGVDTRLFCPGPRNNPLLAGWNIGVDDPVILFMGTIYKFSGLDRVVREFPRVLVRYPAAKLLIVGKGEDEDRLKALARDNGVAPNVLFTGLLPYNALPDLIRSVDICINPFELNGVTKDILPTKLFQYMACGKPVLATPLPGTLTFLEGEDDGVVYASLDDFNARLVDLLSDRDHQLRLGGKAHLAAQRYDWVEIAKTLATWLRE